MDSIEQKVKANFAPQTFMRTVGAELVSVTEGAVEIRMPFSPALVQQHGHLHAGAITSILDSACGYAALSVAPSNCDIVSVEFKVNLLASGKGESFIARAKVKRSGKTLTICSADAFAVQDRQEVLIATMLGTMMNICK